ncbi:MAG: hypothetical protein GEU75_15725 [Dehalococcoidia bacterium]|nr:hypothetical protein [Dehalococcoidia bacterium]
MALPGPESDFSSWTSHGTVSAQAAVALAASGSSVFLFYADADTTTLRLKESADNGATYGSASTVATAASAVTYLAAAVATGGDRVLFWTVGASVWTSRYDGSWSTPAEWTNTVASISGIACRYRLDWDVVICGEDGSGDAKVWTAIYGDGINQTADSWSAPAEVTTATASSGVTFLSPAVEFLQHWRLFFVEKYTGDQAYTRLQWSTMIGTADFSQELWREPAPFDYTGDYGVAATGRNLDGRLWLSAAAGVWSGGLLAQLDLSEDAIETVVQLDQDAGRARVVLRNDPAGSGSAGRYAGHGSAGLSLLQRGARLELAAGYRTPDGAEFSAGPAFWIEAIEQVTGPRPRLVILARDGWWLLERWHARRQFFWPSGAKAVSQLLEFICSRAGVEYGSISSSAALTTLQPAFTVHPGESGKTAVLRLLATVPDVAIMQGGVFTVRHPRPDDEADYEYGTAHAIVAGRYRNSGSQSNRVRVIGSGVSNEAFDFAGIEAAGERIAQVIDLNLTTASRTGDRATSVLRDAEMQARRDEIHIFGVNCGQEVYDVVSVTDPQAGLDAAARRVLGLSWRYSTGERPRYDMALTLGNV